MSHPPRVLSDIHILRAWCSRIIEPKWWPIRNGWRFYIVFCPVIARFLTTTLLRYTLQLISIYSQFNYLGYCRTHKSICACAINNTFEIKFCSYFIWQTTQRTDKLKLLDVDGITRSDEGCNREGLAPRAGQGIGMHSEASQQTECRENQDQWTSGQKCPYKITVCEENPRNKSLMRREWNSAADAKIEGTITPMQSCKKLRCFGRVWCIISAAEAKPLLASNQTVCRRGLRVMLSSTGDFFYDGKNEQSILVTSHSV